MRTVVCFGDSNTHGQVPGRGPLERYPRDVRWPGVLSSALGPQWQVIEEGLSGRTTVHDDPIEGRCKNGRSYLRPCLQSHAPVDVLIIMLGTNDLKARFSLPSSEVGMGIGCLVRDVEELLPGPGGTVPEIIIVSPPVMLADLHEWASIFAGACEKSARLAIELEVMADSLGVYFFDAGTICRCDPADGFHLRSDAHAALGNALAEEIVSIGWATTVPTTL
jgi:lysophospholipase L1-like esterase